MPQIKTFRPAKHGVPKALRVQLHQRQDNRHVRFAIRFESDVVVTLGQVEILRDADSVLIHPA